MVFVPLRRKESGAAGGQEAVSDRSRFRNIPGMTPDGAEVALVLRRVVKASRRRWPRVEILIRGDSHHPGPRR